MVVAHIFGEWFFFARLEVEVDDFMCKGGEFVAEAELVLAGDLRGPRVAIVLLLGVLVQGLAVRVRQLHIYVIVASSDHLKYNNTVWLYIILYYLSFRLLARI